MKIVSAFALLVAGAGLMQASIIESITFDLSAIHAGSTLSGTFTLPNSPAVGDTASVALSFSDPSDYTPTSLLTTITIQSGTPTGFAMDFSDLIFTNLSGSTTPIDTRDIDLKRSVFAVCTSFPCTTTGLWGDRSPVVFSGTYTITPAAVPEPGYALLMPALLTAIAFGRRLLRPTRT